MINILRKNQRALWIVIAFLAIPFIFYFSNSDIGAIGSDNFGSVYDHRITQVEMQRGVRLLQLAQQLGMFEYLQDMTAGAQSESEAYQRFVITRLILERNFEELGIEPTEAQVAQVVKTMPAFQTNGSFDLSKYNAFTQNSLGSLGFAEAQIEQLARDEWSLDRLKQLLGVGVEVPAAESKRNFEQAYGKLDVVVARLANQDVDKEITVSDEDVVKYYESQKSALKTEEKRRVQFVTFALTEEQKKLTGKERLDQLQKLADTASSFAEEIASPQSDFAQLAARYQLPVESTGEFTPAAPDPLLKEKPELTQAANQLTPQDPVSDIVQTNEGFHLVRLTDHAPARLLTMEEARPQVVEAMRKNKLRAQLALKAAMGTQEVREKIKAGTPAEEALRQAGFKPERVPQFALLDPAPTPAPAAEGSPTPAPKPETPDLDRIKQAVMELNPGEVSQFVPTENGGLVAVLEKREAVSGAESEEQRAALDARIRQGRLSIVFQEWLKERREQANVQLAGA